MKDKKKENKILICITICLSILIVLLILIFQVFLPKLNQQPKKDNINFVSDDDLSLDNLHTPSKTGWVKLQLSRRRN